MEDINTQIETKYTEARNLALAEVKRLVFEVFKKNRSYTQFYLAMGTCFFSSKGRTNHNAWELQDDEITKPLFDFIFNWDRVLKLQGEGVYWKRTGEEVRVDTR